MKLDYLPTRPDKGPLWPEIDWPGFGAHVNAALDAAGLTGASLRYLAAENGISAAALSRARKGGAIGAANYLAICAWTGCDPYRFAVNIIAEPVSRGTNTETGTETAVAS